MIFSLALVPLIFDTFKKNIQPIKIIIFFLIGMLCSTSTFALTIPQSLVGTTLTLTDSSKNVIRFYFTTSHNGVKTWTSGRSGIIYAYLPDYIDGPMISYSWGYGYRYDSKIFLTFLTNNSGTYIENAEAGFYGIITTTGTFNIDGTTSEHSINLTPFKPAGWSDKIVVSTVTGTNADNSVLLTTDTLYVDWAVINNGESDITTVFSTKLYVDGVEKHTWTTNSLQKEYYVYVTDQSLGRLTAGTHEIKIVTDVTNTISESNENDNTYTKAIVIKEIVIKPSIVPILELLLN
jgi:hypothetical protein